MTMNSATVGTTGGDNPCQPEIRRDCRPTPVPDAYEVLREKVQGTNINEKTLLATDYLNHFNEVVMLIGMIVDMPEAIEEIMEWRPKSYQDHFRDSAFSDRDLAIEAYDHAPVQYLDPFVNVMKSLDKLVVITVERLASAIEAGDIEIAGNTAAEGSKSLRRLIDMASSIINVSEEILEQSEIDALFAF